MEMAGKETARRRNRDAKENGGEWTEEQEEVRRMQLIARGEEETRLLLQFAQAVEAVMGHAALREKPALGPAELREVAEDVKNYDPGKPLVAIFLGSNQHAGDADRNWAFMATLDSYLESRGPDSSLPGLNSLALLLQNKGYQVKVFETGSNPSDAFNGDGSYTPNVFDPNPFSDEKARKQYAKQWLDALYRDADDPTGILGIGYSWGSSRMVSVLDDLSSKYGVPVLGSVNVDGINTPTTRPERTAPSGTQAHVDISSNPNAEPDFLWITLHGEPANNLPSFVPQKKYLISQADHSSIDNDANTMRILNEFVQNRLGITSDR